MNISGTYDIKRKVGISVLMGLLSLIFAPFGITSTLGEVTIDIPWSLVLPILVAMAYGWQYGTIAGLTGGALFPFLLWANNGWANLFTSLVFLCIYILSGFLNDTSFIKKIHKISFRLIVIILPSILILCFYYIFLFNTALSFNPPFWAQQTIQKIPDEILYSFAIKDSINILILVLVAESLFRLPFVCKILGLPAAEKMRENNKIFVASVLTAIFIWLLFAGLSFSLLKLTHTFFNNYSTLALLVIVSCGIFVSRMIFRFSESQIIIQSELNSSEKKYRELFEANKDGITIFHILPDGNLSNFIEMNEAAGAMLGYTKAELLKMKASDLEIESTDEKLNQRIQDLQTKGFSSFETVIKHKDGGNVPVEISVIRLNNDYPPVLMNITRDITERKLAEEKLKESETKYRQLYEFNQMPIAIFDVDTLNFLSVNNAWVAKYGYSKEELLSMTTLEISPESELERVKQSVRQISNGLENVGEYLHKKKNGQIIKVEIFRYDLVFEGKNAKLVFANDITEHTQAEEALQNSMQLLEKTMSSLLDAVFIIDAETVKIIDCNPAASTIFGYSRQEMLGKTTAFLHVDETSLDDFRQHLYSDMETTKEFMFLPEFRMKHKDGTVFFSEHSVVPLKNKHGQRIGWVSVVRDISERKQAEEELIKSKERYALVIDASEQGIWDWNVETNEVFYSEQWKKMIGYQDHELKNDFSTWVEHLHPDEREFCQQAVSSYLSLPDKHFVLEFRFRHKDGTYRWIHNKAASLKNNNGKVIRMFGAHTDITERKLSEAIFKDIVEKNPISIQILDMDGYPIQVNSAHTNLFGVKPPAGYSVLKDHQLLSLGFDEFFGRIKKGEVVYLPDTFYNVHDVDPSFPDSPVWVKAVGFTLNDNNGKPEKIVLMHENITERKNAEALLNDIIENNPMSIQIVDKKGYTLSENPAFIQLFGSVPPPEFSIFEDLKSKNPELENLIVRLKNGEIVHLPDTYFNAHDTVTEAPDIPLWIRALIFPLNNSKGKPGRFVFMHENITESKISEQELIKAKEKAQESDRLKSAFLANMSHEIRTPMNGILGFAELLKEPGLSGDEQQKYIRIIEKSGTRMLNIINDIVDISKIEAGLTKINLVETNINEQVEYLYTFFKPEVEAKGIKLSFKTTLSAKEATIMTDREKVYAILTNLVKNAIKYSKEGIIEIGYTRVEAQCIAPLLQFYVKDTGIGIPPDRQDAIFERFIQADIEDKMARQGAGLGLTITKNYVGMLGGKIWVESQEGKGSVFYFTLPYNTPSVDNKISKNTIVAGNAEIHVTTLKIMLAEDDEVSELLLKTTVKIFGKEIINARTGTEAVELCRQNPDIDLILMDIRMPELSGYEATRQIRGFNKNVVIIAQTAYGLSGDREKAIEAGCNDYIAKPINKDELLATIRKHCEK
ncbi:MAG: PAS domain S-box protein [Bacteroidales bacterium]